MSGGGYWRARARPVRVLALAVAVALLLAACGGGGPAPVPLEPLVVEPVPADVVDPADPGPARAFGDDSCDPAASLRPDGPLPPPGQMPPSSTMAEIAERGVLIAGVDQTIPLFSFRDPLSGAVEGFDVELAREIAAAIFGSPDRLRLEILTAAERIPALVSGEVDIVVRSMTVTCERWEQVSFSTVYFEAGQRLLVLRDPATGEPAYDGIEDLDGEKVCASAGTTTISNLANYPVEPVSVRVGLDCQVLLQQGQVAAVTSDDALLAGMAQQDPHSVVVGDVLAPEPYGIGIARDAGDLVRFVNGVLERLRADGTWERLYSEWLGDTLGPRRPPPARYRDEGR